MDEFTENDLTMFKLEEKNILREMRGACSRGNHGPMIRQLVDKLNATQLLIERYEAIVKASKVKEVKKPVAAKKPAAKK